jgi:phosphohistidine phosphatase
VQSQGEEDKGVRHLKHLYILRHAKSDWQASFESDHQRPLSKRGTKAASLMGTFLTRLEQQPDLIVSSTAIRARQTAELAKQTGDWSCPLVLSEAIYGATAQEVLPVIRAQDPAYSRLLITGHEPTWSELVAELTGGGKPHLPTAAMARIDIPIEAWAELDTGQGTLIWLVTPRLLGDLGFTG